MFLELLSWAIDMFNKKEKKSGEPEHSQWGVGGGRGEQPSLLALSACWVGPSDNSQDNGAPFWRLS